MPFGSLPLPLAETAPGEHPKYPAPDPMPRAIATLGKRFRIELLLAGLRRYKVTFADPHEDLTGT